MRTYSFVTIISALIFACISAPSKADTTTANMAVNATVIKVCLASSSPLDFGSYDPTSVSDTDSSTTLSVFCTVGTSFTVGLNAGTASGATVTTRKMSKSSDLLNYALYQEAARTNIWGNTPGTNTPAAITAPTTASTLTVYGRVPAGQNVPTGSYTDTVTITVNY